MNTMNILGFSLVLSLGIAFFLQSSAKAADQSFSANSDLRYQALPTRKITRSLPSKRKSYPLLEQIERELYPSHNFRDESPGKRLERLEVATFGEKQHGHVASRLKALRTEIETWHMANAGKADFKDSREMKLLDAQIRAAEMEAKNAQQLEMARMQNQERYRQNAERYRYSRLLMQNRDRNSEGQRMMQIVNPVVRGISQEGFRSIFGGGQS